MNRRGLTLQVPPATKTLALAGLSLGALGLAIGLILTPDTLWANVLLAGFFGVGLGLAGALFIALHFVTGAGWSTALRRVPEAMTALIPVGGILVLIALAAAPGLYPWRSAEHHGQGAFKHFWLSTPFFLGRAVFYLLLWTGLARLLVHASRRQDADGALRHTRRLIRWSPLFLIAFGATFWLASYDWLMSREPDWSSTIYGVYNFAGLFTAGLAVFILLALWLEKLGPFRQALTEKHLHDLGKLLFGMCTFWAYLWYCQYMLIWYVNNPEETSHYVRRLEGWSLPFFYANVVLNWGMPFFALLTRAAKHHRKLVANVCVIVLVGRWLDLDLMILPLEGGLVGALASAGLILGALALFFLVIVRSLGQAALVPLRDPYLMESLPASPNHDDAHPAAVAVSVGGKS